MIFDDIKCADGGSMVFGKLEEDKTYRSIVKFVSEQLLDELAHLLPDGYSVYVTFYPDGTWRTQAQKEEPQECGCYGPNRPALEHRISCQMRKKFIENRMSYDR